MPSDYTYFFFTFSAVYHDIHPFSDSAIVQWPLELCQIIVFRLFIYFIVYWIMTKTERILQCWITIECNNKKQTKFRLHRWHFSFPSHRKMENEYGQYAIAMHTAHRSSSHFRLPSHSPRTFLPVTVYSWVMAKMHCEESRAVGDYVAHIDNCGWRISTSTT